MFRPVVAVLTLILASSFVAAQPLADRVPADALVYIGWQGVESLGPEYEGTHLQAIAKHSQVNELFRTAVPNFIKRAAQESRDPGARDAAELGALISDIAWRRPSAIYVGPPDLTDPRRPMPRVAIVCDAGDGAARLNERIQAILDRADEMPLPIAASVDGAIVTLTIGEVDLNAPAKLNKAESFAFSLDRLQVKPVAAFYLNGEATLKAIDDIVAADARPADAQQWSAVRDALGLSGLKAIAWAAGFEGKNWTTRTLVWAPAPQRGVLALGGGGTLKDDLLKQIPQSATYVNAFTFDPAAALASVRQMAADIGPDARDIVERGLGGITAFLGRNLQTDILEPMGDQWALYYAPQVAGASAYGFVLVNRLDDEAKFRQSMDRVTVSLNNALRGLRLRDIRFQLLTTEIGGMKVTYLGTPFVAPAWMIDNGNLYIGLFPQVAASAARTVHAGGASILENEKFQDLRKRLPARNITGISFNDVAEGAKDGAGYQASLFIVRLLGFMDLYGAPVPEPLLPPLDVMLPHVGVSGSVSWSDELGFHCRTTSAFPGSEMLSQQGMIGKAPVGYAALSTSILLPSLNRARETANRVKSASNLRQIGQACLLYTNENDGRYPDDLGELIKMEFVDLDAFISPRADTRKPDLQGIDEIAAWVRDNSDYAYVAKGKALGDLGAGDVVAYEKPEGLEDGINILFGDGHVDFIPFPYALDLINQGGVRQPRAVPPPAKLR
jgi:prepilin-type processing-associated H-X9-DG protein